MSEQKGIIFDMDNTLLKSNIDFAGMKQAVFQLLAENRICSPDLEWRRMTASQLIELGRESGELTAEMETKVWETVTAFEKEGMHGAVLEDHVPEVLDSLHRNYRLLILTNNAYAAALEALEETGVVGYFDEIVAREQMTSLKPSPSGIHYILNRYPAMPPAHWTMVGDSWIDGRAAQDGSIRFIAYKGNREEMERQQVVPRTYISSIRELLSLPLHE